MWVEITNMSGGVYLPVLRSERKPPEWQVNKHFPPLGETPVTLEPVLTVTTWIHSQHARWISSVCPPQSAQPACRLPTIKLNKINKWIVPVEKNKNLWGTFEKKKKNQKLTSSIKKKKNVSKWQHSFSRKTIQEHIACSHAIIQLLSMECSSGYLLFTYFPFKRLFLWSKSSFNHNSLNSRMKRWKRRTE